MQAWQCTVPAVPKARIRSPLPAGDDSLPGARVPLPLALARARTSPLSSTLLPRPRTVCRRLRPSPRLLRLSLMAKRPAFARLSTTWLSPGRSSKRAQAVLRSTGSLSSSELPQPEREEGSRKALLILGPRSATDVVRASASRGREHSCALSPSRNVLGMTLDWVEPAAHRLLCLLGGIKRAVSGEGIGKASRPKIYCLSLTLRRFFRSACEISASSPRAEISSRAPIFSSSSSGAQSDCGEAHTAET
jgi:hypothetical protein